MNYIYNIMYIYIIYYSNKTNGCPLVAVSLVEGDRNFKKGIKQTYNLLSDNKYFKNKMKETLISKGIFYIWNPNRSTTVLG